MGKGALKWYKVNIQIIKKTILFMSIPKIIKLLAAVMIVVPLNFAKAEGEECTFDLNNVKDCGSRNIERIDDGNGGLLLKLNLKASKAIFSIDYGNNPSDWSVNIGDSRSNDGWGGDSSDQSNDAELFIGGGNQDLNVYGNDYNDPKGAMIKQIKKFAKEPFSHVNLEIENNRVKYDNGKNSGTFKSPFLFALAGQCDDTGSVNYEIFASFNRVISGGRSGEGVQKVKVTLVPNEKKDIALDGFKEGGACYHRVKKGDTLWSLTEKYYGDGGNWKKYFSDRAVKIKIGESLLVNKEAYLK